MRAQRDSDIAEAHRADGLFETTLGLSEASERAYAAIAELDVLGWGMQKLMEDFVAALPKTTLARMRPLCEAIVDVVGRIVEARGLSKAFDSVVDEVRDAMGEMYTERTIAVDRQSARIDSFIDKGI